MSSFASVQTAEPKSQSRFLRLLLQLAPNSLWRRYRLAWNTLTLRSADLENALASIREIRETSQLGGERIDVETHQALQCELEQLHQRYDQAMTLIGQLQNQGDTVSKLGGTFIDRIDHSLKAAREVTEQAALSIGSHVSQLFQIASKDNQMASQTLQSLIGGTRRHSKSDPPLAEVIEQQEKSVEQFVSRAQDFFDTQSQAATNVRDACLAMRERVAKVDQLVFSSELLSFNIRCEAVRLGNDGSPFAVLAEEMVRFSHAIKSANLAIKQSLDMLSDRMTTYYDDSIVMKGQIDQFAIALSQQMYRVQDKTQQLTESLASTLTHMTDSNGSLMSASQHALSELQFQDPLAQDLMRTLHEAHKLRSLIVYGQVDDTRLGDIDPSIGSGLEPEQEPGVVELF